MGVLVPVLCPHCGAKVEVDRDATETTCRYCGTISWIHRPEASRPQPPRNVHVLHLPPPALPAPAAPARKGSQLGCVLVAVPLVLCATVGALVWLFAAKPVSPARRDDGRTAAAATPATPPPPPKQPLDFSRSGRPLVIDANGDGTDDVIVWEGRGGAFVAYDGKGAGRLWRSPALTAPSHHRAFSYLSEGRLVVVRAVDVKLFDVASGKLLRSVAIDDNATIPCRAPKDTLRLLLDSDEVVSIDGGGATKLEKKGATCEEAPSDFVSRPDDVRRRNHPLSFLPADAGGLRCGGINVTGTYQYVVSDPCAPKLGLTEADEQTLEPAAALDIDGGYFVLGTKPRGRRIAMVGRVKDRKLAWTLPISSLPSAEQPEERPERAAVHGKRVAVLTTAGAVDKLTAFNAVDSERQLDVTLPVKARLVAAAKNRWIVVADDRLLSVEMKKGAVTTLAE